jgi:hypothetical protein
MAERRGIHTIFDLRERCEREGQHWLWQGCVDPRGRPMANMLGTVVKGARIAALAMQRDDERGKTQRWFASCGDRLCLSPRCLQLGTHGQAFDVASAAGRLKRHAGTLARLTAFRRSRPDVRPEWMVEWALESPQSSAAVAHGLGVDRSTVGTWRRAHKRQHLVAGPFAQLLRIAA